MAGISREPRSKLQLTYARENENLHGEESLDNPCSLRFTCPLHQNNNAIIYYYHQHQKQS